MDLPFGGHSITVSVKDRSQVAGFGQQLSLVQADRKVANQRQSSDASSKPISTRYPEQGGSGSVRLSSCLEVGSMNVLSLLSLWEKCESGAEYLIESPTR